MDTDTPPPFDYSQVPHDYALCFHHQCPRAAECLRHLAALHAPASECVVRCVNPHAWPADTAACPLFRSMRKVTLAWGVTHLTDGIVSHLATPIMHDVRHLWPHTTYSRVRRLERPIRPDMQERIRRIFAYYVPGHSPKYDRLTEEYDFT